MNGQGMDSPTNEIDAILKDTAELWNSLSQSGFAADGLSVLNTSCNPTTGLDVTKNNPSLGLSSIGQRSGSSIHGTNKSLGSLNDLDNSIVNNSMQPRRQLHFDESQESWHSSLDPSGLNGTRLKPRSLAPSPLRSHASDTKQPSILGQGSSILPGLSELELSGISNFNRSGVRFTPSVSNLGNPNLPNELTLGSLGMNTIGTLGKENSLNDTSLRFSKLERMNKTLGLSMSNFKDTIEHPLSTSYTNDSMQQQLQSEPQNLLNFSSNCWREVNGMLARLGFEMIMDPGRETKIPLQKVVCDVFLNVLYSLESSKSNGKRLERRLAEVERQRSESETRVEEQNNNLAAKLKGQLAEAMKSKDTLTEELKFNQNKINEIKIDLAREKENKSKDIQDRTKNFEVLISRARKELDRREMIINQLKKDITRNKKQIENSDSRTGAIATILPENSKDKKIDEMIRAFNTQRACMENEIQELKKKMAAYESKKSDNHRFSANITYTPSTCFDDNVGGKINPDWDLYELDDSRSSRPNRNPKLVEKELHKAKERISELQVKILSLEEKLKDFKYPSQSAQKRSSKGEVEKLRAKVLKLSKRCKESESVANLRQYMDTRELMKRDKDIHALQLAKVENLPKRVCKEILQDVCRHLSLTDATQIVFAVKKLAKVVGGMRKMGRFVQKVTTMMIFSEHASDLAMLHKSAPGRVFEKVIPALQRWIHSLDQFANLSAFRTNITKILVNRSIHPQRFSPADKITLPLHEITRQIRELVVSEDQLLKAKTTFAEAEEKLQTNPSTFASKFISHFQQLFEVKSVQGLFPALNVVYRQNSESRNLMKTCRSILGLDDKCPVNKCFDELQSLVGQQDTFRMRHAKENAHYGLVEKAANTWKRIVFKLQEILHCDEDAIIDRVEEWRERCTSYDDVFPRVHDLVRDLRLTLGVEHTHEILPRVQELVSAEQVGVSIR